MSLFGGSAASPRVRSGTFAALSEPAFRTLWFGLVLSFTSMSIQNLARGYLAYQITGSGAALGLVLATWGLPILALGLVAGVVTDRVPKRNLLMVTQSTLGLSSLLTAIVIHLGIVELWHLVAIGFLQGVAFAFNLPTRQAIIPELVSRERLPNAVALTNVASNLANIAGPPAAGLLIALPWFGLTGVMYLGAILYLLVLVTFTRLPSLPPVATGSLSFKARLFDGLGYVKRSSILPILFLMQFVPWIVAQPYSQSMPVFAAVALQVGPAELGLLQGSIGFGALAGSLVVASVSASRWKNRLQLISGLIYSTALLGFSVSTLFPLSVVFTFFSGSAVNIYSALNATAIIQATDRQYYGRVLSVSSLLSSVGPLAVFPYGLVLDAIGPRATVGGSGVIVLGLLILAAVLRPSLRQPDPEPPVAEKLTVAASGV